MTRVLVVTGARSLGPRRLPSSATPAEVARELAEAPLREAWGRGLIREAMEGVEVILVGDAKEGGDKWTLQEWSSLVREDPMRSVRLMRYLTRGRDAGWVVEEDLDDEGSFDRTWTEEEDTHPLKRNEAMVNDARRIREGGFCAGEESAEVSVLALLDGTKTDTPAADGKPAKKATRGTEHTVRLARKAGLTVDAQTWRAAERTDTP